MYPNIYENCLSDFYSAETDKAERDVLAVVGADGTVLWVPHQIFRSSCSIDVLNFPFDYQVKKVLHLYFLTSFISFFLIVSIP